MSFGNPVVGGIELVRNAISSPNFKTGKTGWSINRDGSSEFDNVTVRGQINVNSLLYKGDELQTLLDKKSQGVVAQGIVTMPVFNNFGPEQIVVGLQANIVAGRTYRFNAYQLSWNNVTNAYGNGAVFVLRDENNNEIGRAVIMSNGADNRAQFSIPFTTVGQPFGTTGLHNFKVGIAAFGSNISTFANACFLELVDEGMQQVNTGWATTPPATVYKTFQCNAIDSQSYIGGGAASNGSGADAGDKMYFGTDPGYAPNGNWSSLAWFNKNDTSGGNNLGSLNDMAGIASTSIDYLDVFVYTSWWYAIAGGTLVVGYTTNPINHSSYPGGTADQIRINYGGRGVGQWFSIKGTGIQTAILSGTAAFGIQLGPGPDGSLNWYGIADGADHFVPQIRGGYWK